MCIRDSHCLGLKIASDCRVLGHRAFCRGRHRPVREVGWSGFWGAAVFIAILLAGLAYDQRSGALSWAPQGSDRPHRPARPHSSVCVMPKVANRLLQVPVLSSIASRPFPALTSWRAVSMNSDELIWRHSSSSIASDIIVIILRKRTQGCSETPVVFCYVRCQTDRACVCVFPCRISKKTVISVRHVFANDPC